MVWKGTLFFTQSLHGWSECFYLSSETAAFALRELLPLAEKRAALLGTGADLTRVEVSLVGGWRVTMATGIAPRNLPQRAGNPLTGLIIRMQSTAGSRDRSYRRTMLLRGLPDGAFIERVKGSPVINPALLPRLRDYFAVLANGAFFLQVADKDNPWYPVSNIVLTATDRGDVAGNPLPPPHQPPGSLVANVQLADTVTLPPISPISGRATKVFLRGAVWSNPQSARRVRLNGLHAIAGTLPGLVSLLGIAPLAGHYLRGGFLQLRETLYAPIGDVQPAGPGARSCGRPQYPQKMDPLSVLDQGGAGVVPEDEEEDFRGPWGPFSQTAVLSNARDLVSFVYEGYNIGPDGLPECIQIAPIINRPHTWLVGLSGTDLVTNSDTGISADISNGLGLPSTFGNRLHDAIVATVPAGDSLILAGHSLGGMVAQNIFGDAIPSRNEIERIITYGSPLTRFQTAGTVYRMFSHPHDFVINTTPLGLLCAALDHPEQTFVPYHLVPDQPWLEHTQYPNNPALQAWGADGTLVGSDPEITLQLGPVSRFSAGVE